MEEAGVSDFDIIAEVDTTYYEDRAVENDHTYYYTVAAVNRVGEGPVSTVAEAIILRFIWTSPEMHICRCLQGF